MNETAKTGRAIVVGAGFFGATVAERLANDLGYEVRLLEKRGHVGGNSFSRPDAETGIEEHVYGSHIFHTSRRDVWDYVGRFAEFNNYRHAVWARHGDRLCPLPFSLATLNALLGCTWTPAQARAFIERETRAEAIAAPANLEEKALSLVGRTLYEAFVRPYTEKQWGAPCRELPADIIARLPVRYTLRLDYFDDPWQGIPTDGYGAIFQRMLASPRIDLCLNTDFCEVRNSLPPHDLLVYTGPVDRYFDFRRGRLGWRSVRFEKEVLDLPDYQGTAVVNYGDAEFPFTRIHEFKHYVRAADTPRTVIYREFAYTPGPRDELYYPVRSRQDMERYRGYEADAAALFPKVVFGGRLGRYEYCNMDAAIGAALDAYARIKACLS